MMQRRNALVTAMDARLAEIDILVAPTVVVTPPLPESLKNDDELYFKTDSIVLRNITIANTFDLTAVTLPIPGTELPVGLMLQHRAIFMNRTMLSIS